MQTTISNEDTAVIAELAFVPDEARKTEQSVKAKVEPVSCHCNLLEALRHNAEEHPAETAFSWLKNDCSVETSFTWAELWHFSGIIVEKLRNRHGVKPGDRVMIVFPFGLDFILAFLACLRTGIVVVSVYPPNPARLADDIRKFEHFVSDSQAVIALTTRKYASMVTYTGLMHKWPKNLKWVSTDTYPRAKTPTTPRHFPEDQDSDCDALAFIQYTSGSTGNPKGVMITHGNMQHQLYCLSCFPAGSYDVYVGWTPQYHDMGLFNILTALYTRTKSYLISPIQFIQNPLLWPQAIQKYRASWICGPNFAYALTCKRLTEQNKRFDCSSVVFAGFGAEPTQPSTIESAVHTFGIPEAALTNMYGLAEHCVFGIGVAGGHRCHENRVSVGSIAHASALGIEVVVAATQEAAAEGAAEVLVPADEEQVGEVCLRSASCAAGYWGKPELSQSTFGVAIDSLQGTFLRTGDLGYVVGDCLFLACRLKDLIIVNGRNVWPADVEACAETEFPTELRPGCSVAFQGSEEGAVLVCELRAGVSEADALAEEVRRVVERYCGVALEQILLVAKGSVPKTTSGKVERRRTAQLVKDGKMKSLGSADATNGPDLSQTTSLEELFEAAGVVDPSKTVVENGLTSLQLMMVVNHAKGALGVDIDYETLSSTPAEDLIARFAGGSSMSHVPPLLVSPPPADVPEPPALVWQWLLQLSIVLALFATILAAAIPAIAFVGAHFDGDDRLWMHRGRAGPMVGVAVVVWMLCYSALCVLLKWVLVGRMRARYLPLWSARFAAWMLVERLFTVWEYTVGRFFLDTPWLNFFYALLGARVSATARIASFFRCWDLVSLGSRASVTGLLYPRVFDSRGVRFGHIALEEGSSVGSMAVVQGPAHLAERVEVEPAAVVPPHSQLLPAGSAWHGNLCRQRPMSSSAPQPGDVESEIVPVPPVDVDVEAGFANVDSTPTPPQPGQDRAAGKYNRQTGASEPLWVTRLAMPVIFFAANALAFQLATSAVPDVSSAEAEWTVGAWWLALSYVATFLCTGLLLLALVVMLKWSFLSPFLTDALAAIAISTYLPFLERSPLLVGAWQRLLGMRVHGSACLLYSWTCAPSRAHLCSVGANAVVFSTVLAPRNPASVWSYLAGRSGAPWSEELDIVIEENAGLYAQGRVEAGASVGQHAHVAGFARIEHGMRVEPYALMAGNPPVRMDAAAGSGEGGDEQFSVRGWQQVASLLLVVLHRAFVTTVVALGVHFEKALPGAADLDLGSEEVDGCVAVLMRILLLILWITAGELLEIALFKKVVLGRAEAEAVSMESVRALLVLHGSMMWDQSLPLCSALFAGGAGMNAVLWVLGFNIDVGSVLCTNLPCVPAQDAELISIEAGAIVDECAYVSSHNVTTLGISHAPTSVARRAVLHPLAGLFASSLGEGSSLYPRAKSLREVRIGKGQAWVGTPAYQAVCQEPPADSLAGGQQHRPGAVENV